MTIHRASKVVSWTVAGVISTGGTLTSAQIHAAHGTGAALLSSAGALRSVEPRTTEPGLEVELTLVRESLRLSVAETAQLFGVSRPTIYSWQSGKPISPENAERLREIAQALAPHLSILQAQSGRVAQRAIAGRSTLLDLLAQGAPAQPAVDQLAELLAREAVQRERLARRLQGRSGERGAADLDTLG